LGIGRLQICDWSNLQKRDTEIPFPKWIQVEEAICALNNNNLNDLYLIPQVGSLETFLGVGGGAGRYLVTGSIAGNSFPTLVDSECADNTLAPLVVGGQLGEYPRNWLISLDTALAAAHAFYNAGGFDCGVPWAYPLG
jgi:hypothetical protein